MRRRPAALDPGPADGGQSRHALHGRRRPRHRPANRPHRHVHAVDAAHPHGLEIDHQQTDQGAVRRCRELRQPATGQPLGHRLQRRLRLRAGRHAGGAAVGAGRAVRDERGAAGGGRHPQTRMGDDTRMGRFHQEVRALLAAAALAVPTAAVAQGGTTSGAFVVMLGKDTVAVERYARTATTLTGDMIVRNNAPVVWRHYSASLAADGRVTRYEFTNTRLFAGGATQPALHLVGTFTADSTLFAGTFLDTALSVPAATPARAMPLAG